MIKSFEEGFYKNVNEQREMLIHALIDGKMNNYEDYKEATGQLRGLSVAVREFEELAEKIKNEAGWNNE